MTAHFHGCLADHYAALLPTCTTWQQKAFVRAALKYHEKAFKKLNDHVSHPNLLQPVQSLCVPGVSAVHGVPGVPEDVFISSRFG